MKRYKKGQWARMSLDERLAAAGLNKADLVWCEVEQSWENPPPAWYATQGYDTTTHPMHHDLDLGWTCGNWDTSSDFPGIPSWSVWPIHKCEVDMGWTNAMFALMMALMIGFAIWQLRVN